MARPFTLFHSAPPDPNGRVVARTREPRQGGCLLKISSARKEGHLMWPSSCAGLPEQAIKYNAGGHAAPSALRQRNTAEPAPTHARASAIEANKRIKRLRRNGALIAHDDAAANIDAHVAIDQTRHAGAAMR